MTTAKGQKRTAEQANATIEKWLADPDPKPAAVLGIRMIQGEWISAKDAEAVGVSGAYLSQVRETLAIANYDVQAKKIGGNARTYRVRQKGERRNGASVMGPERPPHLQRGKTPPPLVHTETVGESYPVLGSTLIVRALALTDDGLRVQLSDGNGHAWWASVNSHVG